MIAHLVRFTGNTPFGIFGRLIVGDLELFTVEQIWQNNQPDHSCIPVGEYTIEPHDSEAHPASWALVNWDLGIAHYKTPGVARWGCLIHSANRAGELLGCIAPGTGLGLVRNEWAVTHSRAAMTALRVPMLAVQKLVIMHPSIDYGTATHN